MTNLSRTTLIRAGSAALALLTMLAPGAASAHWCNNIFSAPSRIVVKPEVTSVNMGSNGAKLRVYVQNNLPYVLFAVEMRGDAAGYTVTVSPSQQDIRPGQNVAFTFAISGSSGGKIGVDTLGFQLKFRPKGYPSGWLDKQSSCLLNQQPTKSALTQGVTSWWQNHQTCSNKNQATSLNAATLYDLDPKATLPASSPTLGRTGVQELVKLFGYRFCYTGSGSWRCGSQDCPGSCAEGNPWANTNQFPQNCMRAGVELAARKTKLGSALAPARAGATHALKGGCSLWSKPTQHKCLAAVVGAHLWQGAASSKSFTDALKSAGNCVPKACQDAAMRVLTGTPKSSCAGLNSYEEEGACAAAEGLRNNDAPVKNILLAKAGDGSTPSGGGYGSLFYAYMLRIVTAARVAQAGKITYYPDAGAPLLAGDTGGLQGDSAITGQDSAGGATDGNTAKGDGANVPKTRSTGCNCGLEGGNEAGGPAGALILLAVALLARRRRRHS